MKFPVFRPRPWARALGVLTFALLPHKVLADTPAADPARFELEVAGIVTHDDATPPPQHAALFIGSSNIRKWPVEQAFPGIPVINHGFGGSQVSDSVYFFDRLVTPYKPKLVVFHAGGNDLAAGRSPAQIADDLDAFIKELHKALPKTKLIYVGLIPAPVRWGLRDQYHETTKLITARLRKERWVTFIDPEKALLSPQGEIRPELYIEDHLHLNISGYAILTKLVAPDVMKAMGR